MRILKNKKSLCLALILSATLFSSTAFAFEREAISFNTKGVNYVQQKQYKEAIFYFERALDSDSSFPDAYYNLGSVYKYLGKNDDAIKFFKLFSRLNFQDDDTRYLLADLYFQKQEYKEAFIYLTTIDKTSAKYSESLVLLQKVNEKLDESINETFKKKVSNKKVPKTTLSGFKGPSGISEDSEGNLYVADYLSNSIHKIMPGGTTTIIENKYLNGPVGLAIDSSDNLYVANYNSNNVIKITKDGEVAIAIKHIVKPYYVYISPENVLYISEQGTNLVVKMGL